VNAPGERRPYTPRPDRVVERFDGTVAEYLAEIPAAHPNDGRVLVHNLDAPRRGQRLAEDGLRPWLQLPTDRIIECACQWEGADRGPHYRTRREYDDQ
jgi:hypothetical protein